METLFKQLSDAQASLFVLFQKTWVYHWDVVGPDFEEIDTLTEHMRYLGMKPVSTLTRAVEVSTIKEADSSIGAIEMVTQLRDDNKKIIDIFTDISEEADNQKLYATSNLVQTIMETHGKFVWMLRSFLE
jgi:starvation-inducible DNA-binding protein